MVGKLRKTVKFEIDYGKSRLGVGYSDGYIEFITTRGELKKRGGGRGLEFGELVFNSSHKLRVRYQFALEEKLADQEAKSIKIVIDNKIFTINGYELEEEKKFYYLFDLSETK